jgi:hypothetical protein
LQSLAFSAQVADTVILGEISPKIEIKNEKFGIRRRFLSFQSPEVRGKKLKTDRFIYLVFIVYNYEYERMIKDFYFISSLYLDLAKSS